MVSGVGLWTFFSVKELDLYMCGRAYFVYHNTFFHN